MKNKLKIYIYAICKNEEQFVDRWVNSIKDADGIYVLDTGSTDQSVYKLKARGVNVFEKIISPWRFDIARNLSLALVPGDADVCICLDLDEVMEKNWREKIEKLWTKDLTRLRYIYNWYIDEFNVPQITYYAEKIHCRNNFHWAYPVHEILIYDGVEKQKFTDDLQIFHYPDRNKSRSSYLPLLELAVQENPENDRNVHYLGREYMYYEKWNEAIDMLIKHLNLKSATWKEERSASMRFIARCYNNLNRLDEAELWLKKAIEETPHLKDPLVEMTLLKYQQKDWLKTIEYGLQALKITKNDNKYINEIYSWNETVNDILSIAYYNINNFNEAIKNAKIALSINPNNERIKNNLKLFQKKENDSSI
ncbi:MAG: glycosyltransferase [Firmicutes bacterium]|nr:glycosyltransferase [Bacillota bacterium]